MYIVRKQRYAEDPNKKLGSGSEGAVYPFPDDPRLCVKLFHEPERGNIELEQIAEYRARKIRAICGLHLAMPPVFAMPLEAVSDARGKVGGFLMPRVNPGFVKIVELLKPWRIANGIGLKDITLLFAKLIGVDLKEVGRQQLSIGDVNTGCVLISRNLDRFWVDTDSWSYPNFPCLATTELYAHPDLYPNLEKGKAFVTPKTEHDRFALIVMFVQMALQGAHPFRMGIHQKYSSLRERTRHGVTIFDNGVTYPRALPSPDILSDTLLDTLITILKRKSDGKSFDAALLEFADALATCRQCGIEYDAHRAHCPKCHEKTVVDMTKLAKLLIEAVYKVSGTILHVQVVASELRIICQVGNELELVTVNTSGRVSKIPTGITPTKGARYRFFGSCLAVVKDLYAPLPVAVELYLIQASKVARMEDTSTGGLESAQALADTSERFLYRTAGNTLMCGNIFGKNTLIEERVTQVHQTQTWFTVDHATGAPREAIFGYDRALRDIQWFVIRGDEDGNRFSSHDVKLPAMRAGEKQLDFAVYFSNEAVLLVRKTAYRGLECVRYSIITLEGAVKTDKLLAESDEGYECWDYLLGKIFQGESVLHVTPKGIVKQILATDVYQHMEDTEGIITITDQLFRYAGKVGVARKDAILSVSKKTV